MNNIRTSHAIVLYDKKMLFALRDDKPEINDPNVWTFPGGRLELGENYDDGIRRELKEEINVTPQNLVPLGIIINTVTRSRHQMYLCRLTSEEAANVKLGNEGQELRFFSYDEIFTVPHAKYVEGYLSQTKEGIKKLMETDEVDKKFLGFNEHDAFYL